MSKKLFIMIAAAIAMLIGGAIPALATSEGFEGNLIKGRWVNYTKERTITTGGTSIFVVKFDGPEMWAKWRKCTGGDEGDPTWLPNHDPSPRTRLNNDTFRAGTKFCLSGYSLGNNNTDTWSGAVYWNVRS